MKRLALAALVAASTAVPALAQEPAPKEPRVADAWVRLARIQTILEHFYLETGVIPPTLDEMTQIINSRVPRGAKPISLPVDPATGQPFRFKLEGDGVHYVLTVPDASRYGGVKPTLTNVDWGFLTELGKIRRYESLLRQTGGIMQDVATQVELYAKDNSRRYPASFDDMMPKYIRRFPTDPLTGKNLVYKPSVDGYTIFDPNPEKYGLKIFQYNSNTGLQVEQMQTSDHNVMPNIKGQLPSSKH